MTASAPIPTAEEAIPMANPSDTAPEAPHTQAPQQGRTAVASTLRTQVAENPLLSFFGLLIIALLAAAIAGPNIRINDTNERIDRLDARMAAGFDKIDDRFDDVYTRFDQIDARFDDVYTRFDQIDARFDDVYTRFDQIDARFDDVYTRFDQIDARFDDVHARFDQIDARFDDVHARFDQIDARFDDVHARFDQIDARFDELDLKLTALIAMLNATDDVNAAVDGNLRNRAGPSPADADAGP